MGLSDASYKVYLLTLIHYLPAEGLKTFQSFLELDYTVRCDHFDEDTIDEVTHHLLAFHQHCEFFCEAGVHPTGFSLPQ